MLHTHVSLAWLNSRRRNMRRKNWKRRSLWIGQAVDSKWVIPKSNWQIGDKEVLRILELSWLTQKQESNLLFDHSSMIRFNPQTMWLLKSFLTLTLYLLIQYLWTKFILWNFLAKSVTEIRKWPPREILNWATFSGLWESDIYHIENERSYVTTLVALEILRSILSSLIFSTQRKTTLRQVSMYVC